MTVAFLFTLKKEFSLGSGVRAYPPDAIDTIIP
ncbi:hypothetical protein G5S_0692 [Chlamydia pecorum E58]|uniref:Uncharacterized protein n=1 Tax=Chlamydia pecorum (strain ATCC VR-628 / DSM 29919 / E58) TaxID=331635 RepID=A0AA34RDD7_CHLPE|nr:hypothetical protein G5S_0692 [Chlamydia pecorum E58]